MDGKRLPLAGLRDDQRKVEEDESPTLAERLVEQYKGMKEPSPDFAWLFQTPDKAIIILRAIKRQVEWNASHDGQAPPFHDGKLSPYHEALSTMWMECPRFENVGMFQLFINEFVHGIKARNMQSENSRALAAFIASQKVWEEHMDSKPRLHSELRHAEPKDDKAKMQQDAYNALRGSYLRSFIDYYIADVDKAGISDNTTDKGTQARYIRDTAENLLLALRALDEKPDDSLCVDLGDVRDISHNHARRVEREEESDGSGDSHRRKRYRPGRHSRSDRMLDSYRPRY